MQKGIVLLLLLLWTTGRIAAQSCSNKGQNPSSAFPVCATVKFNQADVPICTSHKLNVPGCTDGLNEYEDKNPFWYRITCYTTGTLGFTVTPKDLGDDYDWMLYDITGRDPNDVFTDVSLIVTGNWAGTYGATGASAAGVNYIQCGSIPGDNRPSFAAMPTLTAGHEYLLLISHYTDSQSGYALSFGGGTAGITDPKQPAFQTADAGCGGVTATVKFNKKMKCNSLAANGSDFSLSPAVATIVSASGTGCGNGFDMEEVVLTMSNPLPPGNYTITMKNGSDNNTLLDNCDQGIPVGAQISYTVFPVQPTPMDSIKPIVCAPDMLQLVFRKKIQCSSIAANGSDFVVNGTTPITVTSASGTCTNGGTTLITVRLSAPILRAGNYQLRLVRGSDGNTLIDECSQETPVGSTLPFVTKDTVNADFTYQLKYGCRYDTLVASHDGRNQVDQWLWNFHNEGSSTVQNPTFVFPSFGDKNVKLIVSNGVCSDTAEKIVSLDNALFAAFEYPEVLCPEDMATFKDKSIGKNIITWKWEFGDGSTSFQQNPTPKKYAKVTTAGRSQWYDVRLIVENNHHCFDTADHRIKVVYSCYIDVPSGFTPNSDGKNDFLYPLNAWKAVGLNFSIYNRFGQLVFHTNDWSRQWDGTLNGRPQPTGVFAWVLQYTDRDSGQKIFRKGTTVLIR